METARVPVLPVRIARRALYTRIFREGMLLGELADAATRDVKGTSAQAKTEKQLGSALENAGVYTHVLTDEFAKRRAA